jgi:5-methylcytosine-specific restriction endonuclease McrA
MNGEVLVLNSDYEPLNICNVRRAMGLIYLGKADILHEEPRHIHTLTGVVARPSVVRLRYHVKRPLPQLRLSRRSVFARDHFTCQYCGVVGKELTLDHVIPRRMGGPSTWENLVTCCRKCNTKKGDRTVHQSGMVPKKTPRRPRYVPFISLIKYLDGKRHDIWRDYLPALGDF